MIILPWITRHFKTACNTKDKGLKKKAKTHRKRKSERNSEGVGEQEENLGKK